jgi:hypothetical protein
MLQDFASVRERLKKHGVGFGTHLALKSNLEPYINAEIFLDGIRTVFLHNLAEFHALDEFAEEMAMLLMNNCSTHVTSDMIGLLAEGRVRIIILAPHTT